MQVFCIFELTAELRAFFTTLRQIPHPMKKVIYTLFLAALGFSAEAQINVTDNQLDAVITPETSREELWAITTAFREQGVEMRYDRINFDSNMQLTAINIGIKYGDLEPVWYQTDDLVGDGQVKVIVRPNASSDKVCVSPTCD